VQAEQAGSLFSQSESLFHQIESLFAVEGRFPADSLRSSAGLWQA
jgi:hypothetical protein